MGNNSVASPTSYPSTSPEPTSPLTQESIREKSPDMESNETNQALVATSVNTADAHLSYGRQIIRRDMQTWEALSNPKHFSQRRADFAKVTDWFHNNQSAYYSTNTGDPRNGKDKNGNEKKYCTGLYLAGYHPVGRYVDSEVIITSLNSPDGVDKTLADRKREVVHNLEDRVPVGVAVSKDAWKLDADGNRTFPCPIPQGLDCVVLDWFLVTFMWPKPAQNKKDETRTVWMVRLEKIDLSERSWWSNAAHGSLPFPSLEKRNFNTKAAMEACGACGEESVRIFKSQFVCLNQDCDEWYRVHGEHAEKQPYNIVYNDDFLAERFDRSDITFTPRPLEKYYPNLYPSFEEFLTKNYPESPATAENIAARGVALTTGFTCPQCGMTNSRMQYHGWYCRNTECRDAEGHINPFGYHAPPPTMTPALLEAEHEQAKAKADKPLDKLLGYQRAEDLGSHVAHEFDFGAGCRATLLRPKPGSAALVTADQLFREFQEVAASGALGLARRTMDIHGGSDGMTNHFCENFGERYKLPYALSDIPLDQAPAVVSDALTTANGYMREYFGDDNNECEFNEVNVAAYLSKEMKMNYHDDGETGLGSIIGTWTLGGRAKFSFCIKPQFDYGRQTPGGKWMKPQGGQVDPVPTGCTEWAFRKYLKGRFERGELSTEEWTAQLQSHMDAHMKDKDTKDPHGKRTLLSFTVKHGDYLIMWGPNTQKYMEHSVTCRSPMRFAVTMRRVTKDMGTPAQWARLDLRLKNDKAFTPSWAEVDKKRKMEDETEVEYEGKGDTQSVAPAAKKSKAE